MGILKKHKWSIVVIAILLLAAFLRLYRISDYMTFLGDEGRDVLVARQILQGDFVFLGPRSSAADFFYGPIYYYLITPFLWLFNYDPVGPAVFVALVGIATVYLIYHVGKEFFSVKAGLVAAALYAVSPLVINYSRSSWNPNPMPFVSLLLVYTLYKAVEHKSLKLFLTVGLLFGIAMQMQYIAMFLAPFIATFTALGLFLTIKKHKPFITIGKAYLAQLLGFVLGMSLFLAFEIKNNFPNIRTIITFILFGTNQEQNRIVGYFENIPEVFFRLFGRLMTRFPPPEQHELFDPTLLLSWQFATVLLAIFAIVSVFRIKNRLQQILILSWFFFGVVLFGLYRKPVFDYYLGFLFPLPFLLVGNAFSQLFSAEKIKLFAKPLAVLLFILLFIHNLYGMPFRNAPNRQKNQVKTIAEFVMQKAEGNPFNFALITPGNSDHAYRYYFEILGGKVVTIENDINDPERKTVTDQLLVVCEDPSCSPLGHPLFEVAAFGRAETVGEWPVSVVKVYKLVHFKEKSNK